MDKLLTVYLELIRSWRYISVTVNNSMEVETIEKYVDAALAAGIK